MVYGQYFFPLCYFIATFNFKLYPEELLKKW